MVEFTVGGFNSRWGYVRFGARADMPYDVLAVLEHLDADVLVVPESWLPHDGPGVLDQLREKGYDVAYDRWVTLDASQHRAPTATPGEGWWCLAVASRLPVLRRRDIPLPVVPFDRAGPRVAIHLTVDADGTPLDVIGLHTSSRLWWGAPITQLRGLQRQLPRFDGPAVIAGDFNLWGPWVQRIFPGWHRTVRGRTYPSHRPHSQIDHVLVNDELTVVASEVLDDRQSDHRPVRVRLATKRAAGAA